MTTKKLLLLVAILLSSLMSACNNTDGFGLISTTSAEQQVQTFFCVEGNISNPDCK